MQWLLSAVQLHNGIFGVHFTKFNAQFIQTCHLFLTYYDDGKNGDVDYNYGDDHGEDEGVDDGVDDGDNDGVEKDLLLLGESLGVARSSVTKTNCVCVLCHLIFGMISMVITNSLMIIKDESNHV